MQAAGSIGVFQTGHKKVVQVAQLGRRQGIVHGPIVNGLQVERQYLLQTALARSRLAQGRELPAAKIVNLWTGGQEFGQFIGQLRVPGARTDGKASGTHAGFPTGQEHGRHLPFKGAFRRQPVIFFNSVIGKPIKRLRVFGPFGQHEHTANPQRRVQVDRSPHGTRPNQPFGAQRCPDLKHGFDVGFVELWGIGQHGVVIKAGA